MIDVESNHLRIENAELSASVEALQDKVEQLEARLAGAEERAA